MCSEAAGGKASTVVPVTCAQYHHEITTNLYSVHDNRSNKLYTLTVHKSRAGERCISADIRKKTQEDHMFSHLARPISN